MDKSSNVNGTRILTLVVALLGFIVGVFYHLGSLSDQRVDFLQDHLDTNTKRMLTQDDLREVDRNLMAGFKEKFKEIERNKEEISLIRKWIAEHDRIIEGRDASQWERIKVRGSVCSTYGSFRPWVSIPATGIYPRPEVGTKLTVYSGIHDR